jgi:hypothetical protein
MKLPLIKRIAYVLLLSILAFAGNEYLTLSEGHLSQIKPVGNTFLNLLLLGAVFVVSFANQILQYRFRKSNVISG